MKKGDVRTVEVHLTSDGSVRVMVDRCAVRLTSYGDSVCKKFLRELGITTSSEVGDYCNHEKG